MNKLTEKEQAFLYQVKKSLNYWLEKGSCYQNFTLKECEKLSERLTLAPEKEGENDGN